jgi:hypothetical protein
MYRSPDEAVVERVGDVDVGEQVPGVLDDPGDVPAHVERVRGAVQERHERGVDPAHQVDGGAAVLDEVAGVRLQDEPYALPLEQRQQLLHRAPEPVLAHGGLVRRPAQLGVHHRAPEVHGDLEGASPVPHGGAAAVLVRPRPPVQREDGGHGDTGRVERAPERGDRVPVGPRVQEERQEVVARRELEVGVPEVGDEAGKREQRGAAEHVRVERELHHGPPQAYSGGRSTVDTVVRRPVVSEPTQDSAAAVAV